MTHFIPIFLFQNSKAATRIRSRRPREPRAATGEMMEEDDVEGGELRLIVVVGGGLVALGEMVVVS